MKKKVNSFSGSTLLRLRVFGVKNIKFPRSIGEEISKQNANKLCCGHGGDDSSSCFLNNVRRNTFNLASLHWRHINGLSLHRLGIKRQIVSLR